MGVGEDWLTFEASFLCPFEELQASALLCCLYFLALEAATQLRPSSNLIKIVFFIDLEKNFQPYTKIV